MAVTAVVIARSYPPRRACTITTDGCLSVKIMVILLAVSEVLTGDYAWHRLHVSYLDTYCDGS